VDDRVWAQRRQPPDGYFYSGSLLLRRGPTTREQAELPEPEHGAGELADEEGYREGMAALPNASHQLYHAILARLAGRVVGHGRALRRLALAGLQHMLGVPGQRLVLVGPTGCGKTTMCEALADALEVPSVHVDVAELAETNWRGRDMSDWIAALHHRADGDERRMRRAVVVLDELDKAGVGDHDRASWSYRRGKQESLLSLLGGGTVSYGDARDERSRSWSAREALVVGAGVFDGLPPGPLGPAELVSWGLMPELASRMGTFLRLEPPGPVEVREILWRSLQPVAGAYAAVGGQLSLSEAALDEVTALASDEASGLDLRSAGRVLRSAAEEGLVKILEEADGTDPARYELTPADLRLPPHGPRGRTIGFT